MAARNHRRNIPRTRSLAKYLLLVCLFGLCISACPQDDKPIKKENLLRALRISGVSSKEYVELIGKHGVDFQLLPANEQEIRRAGKYLGKKGLNSLILAIRENYRAKAITEAPQEPQPNIIPVSYRKLFIAYDPSTQTFREADTGIPAVAAQFRNAHEQSKQISEAKDIRAHVYFEPFDFYKKLDRTIPGFANVEEGIWLNEKNALVNFERGETKTLILVVQMQEGEFGGFDAFEHQMRTVDGRELFLPKIPMLTADKYMVKVQITGGAKGDMAELHHFIITLRPEFNISSG